MPQLDLTAGTIEYDDTGSPQPGAPVLVFLHGLVMNGSLWRHVVADLRDEVRCVVPTTPLGGHRLPMKPGADLSLRGQARLVAEFLDVLGLEDVTLVLNDWNCAPLLVADGLDGRIGRLVLSSCETFDNYPPGLPGTMAALSAKVPGGIWAAMQPMRVPAMRRSPIAFGWMAKHGIPKNVSDGWLQPVLTQREVRRDLKAYASGTTQGRRDLDAANASLASFAKPVLVAWATEDKVMPLAAGRRLAESFPDHRFVEIADSYTLIPEDQPGLLVAAIRTFIQESA
jgi:pimeloyl-ACP methyl ester carboxylesterase